MGMLADIRQGASEVPAWGWGLIGLGGVLLLIRRHSAGAASSTIDPTTGAVIGPAGSSPALLTGGGMDAGTFGEFNQIQGMLNALQDSNAQLQQSASAAQAAALAAQQAATATNTPPAPIATDLGAGGTYYGAPSNLGAPNWIIGNSPSAMGVMESGAGATSQFWMFNQPGAPGYVSGLAPWWYQAADVGGQWQFVNTPAATPTPPPASGGAAAPTPVPPLNPTIVGPALGLLNGGP